MLMLSYNLMKTLKFKVYEILRKSWTLCPKKGQKGQKEQKNRSMWIVESSGWIVKEAYNAFCSSVLSPEGEN